ncbi:MAG: phosphate-starvation-inducible protein PsiF [Betaproteobacteria bacterium]|nr:phosphate-starvation-inducible protein PsiF [Betaproteobacteria bacterium]
MAMRKLIAAICFVLAISPLALAQGKDEDRRAAKPAIEKKAPTAKQKARQERTKACRRRAADGKLKGKERKKFMDECLKAEAAAASEKLKARHEKLKACNKQAAEKKLKGDGRKKFMSECLKG